MATVVLAKHRPPRIERGHPWVFRTEIDTVRGEPRPGDIVDVRDHRGRFVGRGYVNPASQIAVRLLTRHDEPVDADFFRRRIARAWQYRGTVLGGDEGLEVCRAVFAEADLLPALVVDRFGDVLVVQSLALGMEVRLDAILDALEDVLHPRGVYLRNDAPVRRLEGMDLSKGWARGGEKTRVRIREGPVEQVVDIEEGQKTGFFLDQRDNRLAAAGLCRGARVLDAFCYTGAFALQAAAAGAAEVVGIEASPWAAALAGENAALNGLADRVHFTVDNAFDRLRALEKGGEAFDVVFLDPPAFVKSRSALEGALRGYKEVNLRAMKLLRPGGYLVTCSCSHHLGEEEFRAVVLDAAVDARRTARLVESRGPARDHPSLLAAPETRYLKCMVLEVLQ